MTAVPEYSDGLAQEFVNSLTAGELDALSCMIDKARERLAAEPRPDVMYVADVPADGSTEIRFWLPISKSWSNWYRITGETESVLGQSYRFFASVGIALHRDEVVQVRPVMDPQTGQTIGFAA